MRSKLITLAAVTAVTALALAGCAPTEEPASDEPVTLSFTWWGNDDRAARYQKAIDLFEQENPNITINGSFSDYDSYWSKRTTEAAGRNLPDVMQFDYSRFRDYAERGQLLDLAGYFGKGIDVSGIEEDFLKTGSAKDGNFAIPTGSNIYGLFVNGNVAEAPSQPLTWDDYSEYLGGFDTATGTYGAADYTTVFASFQLKLRQDGGDLFTSDGKLGFTEKELAAWWSSGQDLAAKGVLAPQQRVLEVAPKTPFGAALVATQFQYDNLIGAFTADLGNENISIVAPPTDDPSVRDLYLKPALQLSAAADTKHPEAVAKFIDFLTNSPEVGEIFGITRGVPASEAQRDGLKLSGLDKIVTEYEAAVADRIGTAPPAPIAGYGSLEGTFQSLGADVALGATTPQDAAAQFFAEAKQLLG